MANEAIGKRVCAGYGSSIRSGYAEDCKGVGAGLWVGLVG